MPSSLFECHNETQGHPLKERTHSPMRFGVVQLRSSHTIPPPSLLCSSLLSLHFYSKWKWHYRKDMKKLMRLSITNYLYNSCRIAERRRDYGGVERNQRVRKAGDDGWEVASESSRDRDNAGNDVVIIFGMRRWPRDCCWCSAWGSSSGFGTAWQFH